MFDRRFDSVEAAGAKGAAGTGLLVVRATAEDFPTVLAGAGEALIAGEDFALEAAARTFDATPADFADLAGSRFVFLVLSDFIQCWRRNCPP
jgi:hypothetical protein